MSMTTEKLSDATIQRKHLVETAGYWFNAGRKSQLEGRMGDAVMGFENAYNHVENALSASRSDSAKLRTALEAAFKMAESALGDVVHEYEERGNGPFANTDPRFIAVEPIFHALREALSKHSS